MTSPVIIAPSLLAADFARLGEEVLDVQRAGADWLHLDVMDGHCVPNLTIGPVVVKPLAALSDLVMDVHLMITDPLKYAPPFVEAGADWVTFHVEVVEGRIGETAAAIRDLGVKVGASVKPGTPVEVLEAALDDLDMVLIMSVEPGFGGQSWMEATLAKATWLKERGWGGVVAMDGGIGPDNAAATAAAGVEMLVAGTSVFGRPDRAQAVTAIRRAAEEGYRSRPAGWPRADLG